MQPLEPVGLGTRVVVDEGDDRAPRNVDSRVSGARQSACVAVLDHGRRRERLTGGRQQVRVVIDDDDHLYWRNRLAPERSQARIELVAALSVVGRDHDGHIDLGGVGFAASHQRLSTGS